MNHWLCWYANNRASEIYLSDIPDLVGDQSNQTSLNNSSDALNNVWPALAGGKKRGVKTVLNVKANKTHED